MIFENRALKNQIHANEQLIQAQAAQLNAINRAMAVIEFDLDGNILTANDNFLTTLGYTLNEVVGKHHSIFVDPADVHSDAYQQFWKKLRSGSFFVDRFKRISKSGNTIWIEASYNPIVDSNGTPYKVIKFATDVTKSVSAELEAKGRLDAINRAMAVIEFDLNGNIQCANDNFLNTMGYQLSEILGKHHRLFVEDAYATSEEYKKFWQQLSSGSLLTGTFKRIDKQGKTIWLEASYNPILDADGKPYKIVKYATDVGSNRNTKLLESVIANATELLEAIASGDLTAHMNNSAQNDQNSMFVNLIDQLQQAINHMSNALKTAISHAGDIAEVVTEVAGSVSSSSAQLNKRMQAQASALEETNLSMTEISNTVQENTNSAHKVAELTQTMQEQADAGMKVMTETIEAMQSIRQSSSKITDIVSLIDSIAFQTNLLALNAAVEAARAGEHGRGFAVVAGEVRALAQKSSEAAKDIRNLIGDSVARVENGTHLADKSGEMLTTINDSVGLVTQMVQQIATASYEQTKAIGQIHQSLNDIDIMTQENTALIHETSTAANSLSKEADDLRNSMAFFKTDTK